jgi:hypothetical protein
MTSLQWRRVAICREHDVHVLLSRKGAAKAGGIGYIYTVQYLGRDGTLRHWYYYFCCRRNPPSTKVLDSLFVRKEAISLIRLVENYISDNCYGRPGFHIVSKAFWLLSAKLLLATASKWFLIPSPMGLMTAFYCLTLWDPSGGSFQYSPINCCWQSPALSLLVFSPVGPIF